jgi:hypothetical protein
MELKEFIKRSLKGENLPRFIIGTVNDSLSIAIKKKTGLNVLGYKIAIDSYDLRHIINSHGDKLKEAKRGQISVLPSDFILIPDIVKHSDIIFKSKDKTKSHNRNAIYFIKQYENEYWVIEQVIEPNKTITIKTMYIKKNLLP